MDDPSRIQINLTIRIIQRTAKLITPEHYLSVILTFIYHILILHKSCMFRHSKLMVVCENGKESDYKYVIGRYVIY